MGRPLVVDWKHTSKRLFIFYRREQDVGYRMRLQALMLLRQQKPLEEVARIVGVAARTVRRWVAWYRSGGLAEVEARRVGGHGGAPRRLSPAQEAALKAKAAAGELRSIQDGVTWAAAQGVTYTYWGMRGVYARLALTHQVPRPRHPRASAAAQAAWKKKD